MLFKINQKMAGLIWGKGIQAVFFIMLYTSV